MRKIGKPLLLVLLKKWMRMISDSLLTIISKVECDGGSNLSQVVVWSTFLPIDLHVLRLSVVKVTEFGRVDLLSIVEDGVSGSTSWSVMNNCV